jgi:hypothetical protein
MQGTDGLPPWRLTAIDCKLPGGLRSSLQERRLPCNGTAAGWSRQGRGFGSLDAAVLRVEPLSGASLPPTPVTLDTRAAFAGGVSSLAVIGFPGPAPRGGGTDGPSSPTRCSAAFSASSGWHRVSSGARSDSILRTRCNQCLAMTPPPSQARQARLFWLGPSKAHPGSGCISLALPRRQIPPSRWLKRPRH